MKAFLLTVTAIVAIAGSMFAQNLPPDYHWEIGVNGGLSGFTRPLGTATGYSGTSTNVVPDWSLRVNYYFNSHWMLDFDLGARRWQTQGTWQLEDQQGEQLKPREVDYLVAAHAINESFAMNYIIPFYDHYGTFNKANLNFGAMFGLVTTVNDGSIGYSKYNAAPDSNYVYASRYDYGFGIGYSFGIQAGFTYYIIPQLGVNIDLAMRYVDVGTNDVRYAAENNRFNLLYFPETIGLRWRFSSNRNAFQPL